VRLELKTLQLLNLSLLAKWKWLVLTKKQGLLDKFFNFRYGCCDVLDFLILDMAVGQTFEFFKRRRGLGFNTFSFNIEML
jgi:hypothetical protein